MFCKICALLVFAAICFGSSTGSKNNVLSINPQKAIEEVGDVAQILCIWKDEPLMQCLFKIPQEGGQYRKISLSGKNLNNDTSITYFGNGLEKGECGMKMKVEEKYQGNITCELTSDHGDFLEASMELTVAKKPKDPVLSLNASSYLEGTNVTATCVVAEGRPAADVTWFFDGKEDFNNMIKQQHRRTEQPVGTTTTVTEVGSWTVTADDDQKSVTCSADHHSWKKPQVVRKSVTVQYKPRISNEYSEVQNYLLYPNLVLGEAATVIVKLKSNPDPTGVQITLDNTTLTIGQDSDEKYQISELEQQKGFRLYSLVIKNLTKEDLGQVCWFNATNAVGSSAARLTFSVRPLILPNSPEKPRERAVAGSSLTGVIIGASIIVIITIGLIMFAKINNKWCFAAKPPVYTGHVVPIE